MEAVVLAAVLGVSVLIAVAGAFGALTLAMYLIDVASGATASVRGDQPATVAAQPWPTELALNDPPGVTPSLAA
jgi:hypothetical protein